MLFLGENYIIKALNKGCTFDGSLGQGGGLVVKDNYVITPFVEVVGGHAINFAPAPYWWYNLDIYMIEYNSSKERLDFWRCQGDMLGGRTVTTKAATKYVRFSCPAVYLTILRIKDMTDDTTLFEIIS